MRNLEFKKLSIYANKSSVYLSLAAFFLSLLFASQTSAAIVINEVYGAGGNTGAIYNQDYIELYNNGTTNVDISGYSIQYNAPTGVTNYTVCAITATDTVIEPGTYFLIATGPTTTVGAALPSPDASCSITLNATGGKVALVSSITQLIGGTCPPTGATIIDFVGYGNANCFETTAASAPPNSQSSVTRITKGVDTNNNSADFTSRFPTPQSSLSPTAANATVGGRITDARGRGLRYVTVMMVGGGLEEPIYASTSAFGYYQFNDVPTGDTYVLSVFSRRYRFNQPSMVINVYNNFTDANFIGYQPFQEILR